MTGHPQERSREDQAGLPGLPAEARQRGFTLIELLVVVAIVGILSGIAAVKGMKLYYRARAVRIVAEVRMVHEAALRYYADAGAWPADEKPGEEPADLQPYLKSQVEWQHEDRRYDWILWNPASTDPGGRFSGEYAALSVKVTEPRVLWSIVKVYDGPVYFAPGNRAIFPIDNSISSR